MEYETAGDPISGLKWTRKTPGKIAKELERLDITVSGNTVARLLKELKYSLRTNRKKLACCGKRTRQQRRQRDLQFGYISTQRHRFAHQGNPIISVDTKKKELVGNFKNPGQAWRREDLPVNDHDFPSLASGQGISYGIYDTEANRGSVFVGTSHNTPSFAIHSIATWWQREGRQRYPNARKLLILADNGGSNRPNSAMWLQRLSEALCEKHGLSVTVCHYPPGASKWNPIEHRLFSEISKNWAGVPLTSYELMLNYIRTTKTSTGLSVRAFLVDQPFPTHEQPSADTLLHVKLRHHDVMPEWNYTIRPK